jgi:hypothetical protein
MIAHLFLCSQPSNVLLNSDCHVKVSLTDAHCIWLAPVDDISF